MKKHIGKILAALVVVYLLVNMAAVIHRARIFFQNSTAAKRDYDFQGKAAL